MHTRRICDARFINGEVLLPCLVFLFPAVVYALYDHCHESRVSGSFASPCVVAVIRITASEIAVSDLFEAHAFEKGFSGIVSAVVHAGCDKLYGSQRQLIVFGRRIVFEPAVGVIESILNELLLCIRRTDAGKPPDIAEDILVRLSASGKNECHKGHQHYQHKSCCFSIWSFIHISAPPDGEIIT